MLMRIFEFVPGEPFSKVTLLEAKAPTDATSVMGTHGIFPINVEFSDMLKRLR